jgi:glycosyltransferase involved in cell wall biosynthesis
MTSHSSERHSLGGQSSGTNEQARSALLVGNFGPTSNRLGLELAERLRTRDWNVSTTSLAHSPLRRTADIAATVLAQRHRYTVAQVDVYSGPAFRWAELACALLQRLDKPYVLTLHGGALPRFGRWYPRRVDRLLNSARVVTTPSPYLQREMAGFRSDLLLLPNARDLTCFRPRVLRKAAPRLVWLRRFVEIYNPAMAVQVLALLVQRYPEATLTMVGPDGGDGTLRATQRLAQELGVADRVQFPGAASRSEVPAHLEAGDIFLNTTNVDNTPLSVLEAMAAGMCVVSTNVGGLPDMLRHEGDALLVPPENPEAMAGAVERILQEPSLAERLSGAARSTVSHYDWETVLPLWEALLSGLLGGPA